VTLARLREELTHNALDPNAVAAAVVDEQLRTAAALLERLDEHGGVILGDEVGAGKTFVTFAVLADRLLQDPTRGAVIFVPSDPLQRKWKQQFIDYLERSVNDRKAGAELAKRVGIMNRSLYVVDDDGEWSRPRADGIVIAPHRAFSGKSGNADRALCIERWLDLRCSRQRKPWKPFFAACGIEQGWAVEEWATWAAPDVLTAARLAPIDAVFASYEAGQRDLKRDLAAAVQTIRRDVARKLLPNASIVVVDEAHNLKSTHSQVYQSLMYVLQNRFDGMLFLTATPFQLGREELRNIVEFFRSSRPVSGKDAVASFDARIAKMDAGMNAYVTALEAFGDAWRDLNTEETVEAERLLDGVTGGDVERLRPKAAAARFQAALEAKSQMEVGLRPFIVRSVRERHHTERYGVEEIPAGSRIPVALVDRLISERLASRQSTFVASALTGACSSWEALFDASIAADEHSQATLVALRRMRDSDVLGPHPKMRSTLAACMAAVHAHQEKSLVFVERMETGRALRDALKRQLPDGRDTTGYARLQSPQRFGWPSLRENYLHTIYADVFGAPPTAQECREAINEPSMIGLWARLDEEKLDYRRVKRFIEHAMFRAAVSREASWSGRQSTTTRAAVENLLEADYVVNGLDLLSGSTQERRSVPVSTTRETARPISDAFVEAYAAYPSPWATSRAALAQLDPIARAELVDAAASAIASSHLQAEVVQVEADGDPFTHFVGMGQLLCGDGPWRPRFEAIAQQAADLAAGDRGDATDRILTLAAALRASERVQFVSGETKNDAKARAIAGFNTPLYPEVLITTGVLAEGVDLHRSCRRVIHHDLPWNPAKLEQRTGRVDRIGSLSSRLRQELGSVATSAVDVGMPYVAGTYDETIFQRVLARRREFRCILGNKPEWERDELTADEALAWPEGVVERLQVQLGPG
jgi:hypothetical protein